MVSLASLTREYARRKRVAERAVTSREWATGPFYGIVPRDENDDERPGHLLRGRSTKAGTYEFGFDDERRLRLIRKHVGRRGCAYETFIEWGPNKATLVRYDYDPKYKTAMVIGVLRLRGGRPMSYTHKYAGGTSTERYEYRGDELVAIRFKNPDGSVEVRRPKPHPKPPPVSSARARELLGEIEALLVAKIPAAIRAAAARGKSPVWGCGLVFDSSEPVLPPEIALATVGERDAVGPGWTSIWNCESWDGMGAAWVSDRGLDAACKVVNESLRAKAMSALVLRVAQRLNRSPRAPFGKVADDFLVFAFDRNRPAKALLAKSLTVRQRTFLKRGRGCLAMRACELSDRAKPGAHQPSRAAKPTA